MAQEISDPIRWTLMELVLDILDLLMVRDLTMGPEVLGLTMAQEEADLIMGQEDQARTMDQEILVRITDQGGPAHIDHVL